MFPWQPIINSIGLLCDITGAFMVAIEVVKQYKGSKHIPISPQISDWRSSQPVLEDPNFRKYEREKYKWMKRGLFFLVLGFVLQGISAWLK